MTGHSKRSSKIKPKSKTELLTDEEKAEKAADKEFKRQANLVRATKLEHILAMKLDPNAVRSETTAEMSKVAEKARIKAKKEEVAKQEAERIELAKKEAEERNQEFIRRTREIEAQRIAQVDEIEARKKAKEDSEKLAMKHFDELPVFERLGLTDEMVLAKIKLYVILLVILLVITLLHDNDVTSNTNESWHLLVLDYIVMLWLDYLVCFVWGVVVDGRDTWVTCRKCDCNKQIKKYVYILPPVVLLVLIFKFCTVDKPDYKKTWIEQEARRINVQISA
jgi:hypothetical protein